MGYRILDAGITYTHGMEANQIGSELKSLSEILDNNYNKKHIEEKLEHYSDRYGSVQINQNSIQLDKATLYFNEGELYKITLLSPDLEDN